MLALVAAGGAVGTWGRAALGQVVRREPGGWPWSTLLVNLVGALVLSVMLELLGRLRRGHLPLRLALGTGLMGGFTTYSAFAVETVDLLRTGQPVLALLYAVLTLLGGLLMALFGLWLASPGRRTLLGAPLEQS